MVFPASALLSGGCDNLKCALKLVTNLKRSRSLEAIAERLAEENKKKVPDAFKDLIPIDSDRVCVIKGKLTHHKVKRHMVQPHFDRAEFPNEHAAEGEAVLALKSHKTGAQKLFWCTSKIPLEKWCHPADRRIGSLCASACAKQSPRLSAT